MAVERQGDSRSRNWALVLYPESVPPDWRDVLDHEHVPWVCSPLHDRDVNADGEPKKAHWHVLLLFPTLKSYEQVKSLTDMLNGPIPQRCADARGMVRYMAHLDNPEKAQYDPQEIVSHGGADISRYLCPTASERYALIREMQFFVRDNRILEYQDLMDYAAEQRYEDWYPLLCDSCTYVLRAYIKSYRYRQFESHVDPETGEVICHGKGK